MKRVFCFSALALILAWFGRDGVRVHAQTKIAPGQMKAPRVSVLQCAGSTSATSDCTGLYYVDVFTPAGTELKIIGAPATAAIDTTHWSLVP